MPFTRIDTHAALVVIDLQQGIAGLPTVYPAAEIVERTAHLACAFRVQGQTVVLVTVTGVAPGRTDAGRPVFSPPPGWTDLVPELEPKPGDVLITTQRWGAFLGTSLDAELRARGVTQIVLAGIATSAGVESTARSAYDLGYSVAFIVDAMTDRDPNTHAHSVEKIFPRLGEITNTDTVLRLLDSSVDRFFSTTL